MRLAAWLIDSMVVFVGLLAVRLVLAGVSMFMPDSILGGNVLFHYTWKDIVLYLGKALYFILLTYYTGTTLGKKLLNLRVVNADGSEHIDFLNVVYRETIGRFLSAVLCIGYLMAAVDKKKRGLHDRLAETNVIYAKKVTVYSVSVPFVTSAPKEDVVVKTEPIVWTRFVPDEEVSKDYAMEEIVSTEEDLEQSLVETKAEKEDLEEDRRENIIENE